MAKKPNQKLKILYLYQILLKQTDENHPMSTSELISALSFYGVQAERKSIYSDLDLLRDFGLDIVTQRGNAGGHFVASRDFELPELKLLVDAVQSSRFITEKKSRELIKKVESLASDFDAKTLQRQVYISDRIKTVNENIYYNIDTLHNAISNGKQIKFRYFRWITDFQAAEHIKKEYRKDGAFYQLSPWALTWEDENYYLVAFSAEMNQIRHYRVDKMENIEMLDITREGKADFEENFNIASYSKKIFGMFSGEEKSVTLRCENQFIGVIRDRFGKEIMIRPDGDNHFIFTTNVAISPQFFSWIFGLSGGVQIIAPIDVQENFKQELKKMLT